MRRIVVSGMHRSGTSAFARVVNLLGVDLGDEDRLMGAKPDNPTGFWENLSLSAFNDDLLAFLGGRWDDPPVLLEGWEAAEELGPWRARAQAVVTDQLSGDVAGWKDPRMSLLLPFWRTVVPIEAGVLVLRRPAEVAGSLAARDRMPAESASRLWLRYVVAARRNDPEGLVVDYDDLFSDLDGTIERLVAHLLLEPPTPEVRAAIGSFLDRGLRHHREEHEPEGPAELELADIAFEAILANRDRALVDALATSFEAPALAEAAASLRQTLARLEEHRDDLIRQRDVAVRFRDEVQRERDAARELARKRDAQLATVDERLEMKSEQIGRLEATGERLRREIEAVRARAEAAEAELGAMQARNRELTRSPLAGPKAWARERMR